MFLKRIWAAHPLWVLVALGFCSVALYGWFPVRYGLTTHLTWQRGGWFAPMSADLQSLWIHLGVLGALTGLYSLALRLPWPSRPSPATLALGGAVIGIGWLAASFLLLGATPSGDSHDIYDYLYRGRLFTEQGISPLAVAPEDAPRQSFFYYTAWKKYVDTYGPLWEYTSAGVSRMVRQNPWLGGWAGMDGVICPQLEPDCAGILAYVTGYRLWALFLTLLSGGLVFVIVQHHNPAHTLPALIAWFWNPLLVFAIALGGHNDALMLLLILIAFLAWQRGWWLTGILALFLAAHVKLTALIWGPLFAFWLWRQRGLPKTLGLGVLALGLGLPLSWALYQPLGGWQTLSRMLHERTLFVANSPWQLLDNWLRLGLGWSTSAARRITTGAPTYLFGLVGLGLPIWLYWRRRIEREDATAQLWVGATVISLLYLLVGSFWFQHWYVTWVLTSAVLLPARGFTRTVLPWLCFGALASNILYDTLSRLPVFLVSTPVLHVLVVTAIWLPPLLAAGWLRRSPFMVRKTLH